MPAAARMGRARISRPPHLCPHCSVLFPPLLAGGITFVARLLLRLGQKLGVLGAFCLVELGEFSGFFSGLRAGLGVAFFPLGMRDLVGDAVGLGAPRDLGLFLCALFLARL